jgi:predicted O-methyltransferase YrrM
MRSSYLQNNYGKLFEALVLVHSPKLVVECGILDGYSLFSMARTSKECIFFGIDLFDSYEFKHGNKEALEEIIKRENLNVKLIKEDAIKIATNFSDSSVDILHIDISNDGEILPKVFDAWKSKIANGGLFIFEGGSKERDEIEWMMKYNKIPISNFKNSLKKEEWEFITLSPYPSLTICKKTK